MGKLGDIADVASGRKNVKVKVGIEPVDASIFLGAWFLVLLTIVMIQYNLNKKLK